MHRLQELVRLHRMGEDGRSVARALKMSPNTERKYRNALKQAGLLAGSPTDLPEMTAVRAAVEQHAPSRVAPQEESTIAAWAGQLEKMLSDKMQPKAIYDRLRQERSDFSGSYDAVKRMCKRLRAEQGPSPDAIALRVETEPGEIAQVDFGEIDRLCDPEQHVLRRAWVS